jgi:hypothetical protein
MRLQLKRAGAARQRSAPATLSEAQRQRLAAMLPLSTQEYARFRERIGHQDCFLHQVESAGAR